MYFQWSKVAGGPLPVGLPAADQIRIQRLYVVMRKRRRYEELIVKYHHMLYILCVLNQEGVYQELGLQELLLVNRTVEKSLKLQVPEKVALEFSREKVKLEVFGKISQDLLEGKRVRLVKLLDPPVKQLEVPVIRIKHTVEYLRVLLAEGRRVKLVISNGLCLLLGVGLRALAVERVRVREDDVEPDGGLHFFHNVREIHCRDALDGLRVRREGREKGHNAL